MSHNEPKRQEPQRSAEIEKTPASDMHGDSFAEWLTTSKDNPPLLHQKRHSEPDLLFRQRPAKVQSISRSEPTQLLPCIKSTTTNTTTNNNNLNIQPILNIPILSDPCSFQEPDSSPLSGKPTSSGRTTPVNPQHSFGKYASHTSRLMSPNIGPTSIRSEKNNHISKPSTLTTTSKSISSFHTESSAGTTASFMERAGSSRSTSPVSDDSVSKKGPEHLKLQPVTEKKRVIWNPILQKIFLSAMDELGPNTSAKPVLDLMKQKSPVTTAHLQRSHVSSHLQKHKKQIEQLKFKDFDDFANRQSPQSPQHPPQVPHMPPPSDFHSPHLHSQFHQSQHHAQSPLDHPFLIPQQSQHHAQSPLDHPFLIPQHIHNARSMEPSFQSVPLADSFFHLQSTQPSFQNVQPTGHSFQSVKPTDHSFSNVQPTDHSFQSVQPTDHSFQNVQPTDHSFQSVQPTGHSFSNVQPTDHSFQNVQPTGHSFQSVKPTDHSFQNVQPTDHSFQSVKPTEPSFQNVQPTDHSFKSVKPTEHSLQNVQPTDHSFQSVKPTEQSLQSVQPTEHPFFHSLSLSGSHFRPVQQTPNPPRSSNFQQTEHTFPVHSSQQIQSVPPIQFSDIQPVQLTKQRSPHHPAYPPTFHLPNSIRTSLADKRQLFLSNSAPELHGRSSEFFVQPDPSALNRQQKDQNVPPSSEQQDLPGNQSSIHTSDSRGKSTRHFESSQIPLKHSSSSPCSVSNSAHLNESAGCEDLFIKSLFLDE